VAVEQAVKQLMVELVELVEQAAVVLVMAEAMLVTDTQEQREQQIQVAALVEELTHLVQDFQELLVVQVLS
jgi:hypothetical protein